MLLPALSRNSAEIHILRSLESFSSAGKLPDDDEASREKIIKKVAKRLVFLQKAPAKIHHAQKRPTSMEAV